MKTTKVHISGVVQGVFFRKFIEEKAKELGLKGFVRNLNNGNVEVVIEGEDGRVKEILSICKEGSPHTKINHVEIKELKHQGFKDFKILKI